MVLEVTIVVIFVANAEVWKEEDALERQGGNMILGLISAVPSEYYCVGFAS